MTAPKREGILTKKLKNGRERYYPRYEAPSDDGRRRQLTGPGFDTVREAKRWRREQLGKLDRGEHVDRSTLTVGEYLRDKWLPAISASVKPGTLRGYEQHVAQHIAPKDAPEGTPYVGHVKLQGLKPGDLLALYGFLGRPTNDGGRGLSPATVRRVHATIHSALAHAVTVDRLVNVNVAAGLRKRLPKMDETTAQSHVNPWEAAELRAFLDGTEDTPLGVLWQVYARCGLRRGEALALKWDDVDLDGGSVIVRRSLLSHGSTVTVSSPKSGKSRRVPIRPDLVARLKAHRATQAQDRLAFGPGWEDSGYVFTRADGSHLLPNTVTHRFLAEVARTGVRRIRLHDLRHTFASLLLAERVPMHVVKDLLGHSSIAITVGTYGHLLPGATDAAAEALERAIG
jgi:integrase